jgi:hypothetical protein
VPNYNMATLAAEAVKTCATKLAESTQGDPADKARRAAELEIVAEKLGQRAYGVGEVGAAAKHIVRVVKPLKLKL